MEKGEAECRGNDGESRSMDKAKNNIWNKAGVSGIQPGEAVHAVVVVVGQLWTRPWGNGQGHVFGSKSSWPAVSLPHGDRGTEALP